MIRIDLLELGLWNILGVVIAIALVVAFGFLVDYFPRSCTMDASTIDRTDPTERERRRQKAFEEVYKQREIQEERAYQKWLSRESESGL